MDDKETRNELPNEEEDNGEEAPSLAGKGWDILAGGKENSFAMGGDDPFDLKSADNPNPYTDDDEANWILTSGAVPPPPESDAPLSDRADEAPRDVSSADLAYSAPPSPTPDPASGPITAPPYLYPGGSEEPPGGIPELSDEANAGVSPGVLVTPIASGGGEPAVTAPPVIPPTPADYAPDPSAYSGLAHPRTGSGNVPPPASAGGVSPGVSVTPLDQNGDPISEVPLGGSKEMPGGGPIMLPAEPLIPPAATPPISDIPPWELPPTPGSAQGGFSTGIADPFGNPRDMGSFLTSPLTPVSNVDELEPDAELRSMLITTERVNELWDEIGATFDLIVSDVRGYYGTTEQAITDLKRARELLLAGTQYYDNAERLVVDVRARLRLEEKVRQWSRTRGTWLGVYLVLWLLALSLASVLTVQIDALAAQGILPETLSQTWLPGLFGGLGGVIGALWVLVKHIAVRRDFDPQNTPWYIVNPIMGVAMGVVTYFVLWVASNSLLGIVNIKGEVDFTTGYLSAIRILLAFVVGFNQNVLWSLINRIMNAIFPGSPEESTATIDAYASSSKGEPGGPQG